MLSVAATFPLERVTRGGAGPEGRLALVGRGAMVDKFLGQEDNTPTSCWFITRVRLDHEPCFIRYARLNHALGAASKTTVSLRLSLHLPLSH